MIKDRKIKIAVKPLRSNAKRATQKSSSVGGVRLTLRAVPGLSVEAISESIREVKQFSRERRASDEISQELMSMPVSA
jgi:hypothetical protein